MALFQKELGESTIIETLLEDMGKKTNVVAILAAITHMLLSSVCPPFLLPLVTPVLFRDIIHPMKDLNTMWGWEW
ncbi:hypothetical protein BDQ17DRAFT_1428129 [Cyathus striatus]|nr:hypothetical protein BDQ17DRAFT_1428129 [Cyathus striatus]